MKRRHLQSALALLFSGPLLALSHAARAQDSAGAAGVQTAPQAPAASANAPAAPPGVAASASPPASTPSATTENAVSASCTERIPAGKERPSYSEELPKRATSGHALTLLVTVLHGRGETVLPTGFRVLAHSPEAKSIEQAGFFLPDPNGPAKPKLTRTEQGERVKTVAEISFVPLPAKPGRNELVLPPVPITISRASGELVTVCTRPHPVTVEDPIANLPNPAPKENPPPRRQLEEWTTAKYVVYTSLIALVVGAIVAWLVGRFLKRPRKAPPPPPPRPPWETALEALHDIRHAGLMRDGRFSEHFDRVSDVIRKYLGERYGFDGLECTTREMITHLREVTPFIPILGAIEIFLRDADLVKFARLTPSETECVEALARAEDIVRKTVPDPLQNSGPLPPSPADADAHAGTQAGGAAHD